VGEDLLDTRLNMCENEPSFSQLSKYSLIKRHGCILIYIEQDAMLHSLFYLKTALHVSSGTITHHQERKQLYLQHLVFVTPLLLPAAIYCLLSDKT
jgi:hypothetical protein